MVLHEDVLAGPEVVAAGNRRFLPVAKAIITHSHILNLAGGCKMSSNA
jgi:hypothetical protein